MTACNENGMSGSTEANGWKDEVDRSLLEFGHRNWIVITDSAYPMQTSEGVSTIVADIPYNEVLSFLIEKIKESNHVYAHVYQDKELTFLSDSLCPGIEKFRKDCEAVFGSEQVNYIPHEEMIARLDGVSKLYKVLIVKTPLCLPFTTTFLELDCKYWNAGKQEELSVRMKDQ